MDKSTACTKKRDSRRGAEGERDGGTEQEHELELKRGRSDLLLPCFALEVCLELVVLLLFGSGRGVGWKGRGVGY